MSDQLSLWDSGQGGSLSRAPGEVIRASIARELRYLLSISNDAGKPYAIRQAGIAYSVGVALIEDYNVVRGKGSGKEAQNGQMPRFVDVKLTADERDAFVAWAKAGGVDVIKGLQAFADDGYRVGVTWASEQQAYTVSVTCRLSGSPNQGLCMTSFAKTLDVALLLALYKHQVIAGGNWLGVVGGGGEDFG